MIDAKTRRLVAVKRREALLVGNPASGDDEAQMAAALRVAERSDDSTPASTARRRRPRPAADRGAASPTSVADEIADSVEARLPGRIRDLAVRVRDDQFVLSGVSSSYYVKQVAQHVAMNALNAFMLGRLVNDIKVQSVR